jgi:hypothetical protein
MLPALARNHDLRLRLGRTHKDDFDDAEAIVREMKTRMDVSSVVSWFLNA